MKKIHIKSLGTITLLAGLLMISSCKKDSNTIERGYVLATVDYRTLTEQDTILFTDMSTNIGQREWTFEGGSPSTSSDSLVRVKYVTPGTYTARLVVSFKNKEQQADTMTFTIKVNGKIKDDTYAIYTEDPTIVPGVGELTIVNNNAFPFKTITAGTFEGSKALDFNITGAANWAMASIQPKSGPVNISKYANGYYNIALKSSSTGANGVILLRLQSNSEANKAIITFTDAGEYGFSRDGQWHFISIPIADFKANNPKLDLTSISSLLVFRSGTGDVTKANNYDFQVDHFFLSLVKYNY